MHSSFLFVFLRFSIVVYYGSALQGGPAKVRPTYIFAGNIILVTFECIGKIQWFLADRTIGRAYGTVCRLSVCL